MSKTSKKSWRPGMMTWLIVAGLILLNAAFILDAQKITLHYILYYVDFRHWPSNLGWIFWLIFLWLLADTIIPFQKTNQEPRTKNVNLASNSRSIRFGIQCTFATGILFLFSTFLIPWHGLGVWCYRKIWVPYYLEPMSMFFYNGSMTIRLAIPPLTGIVTIGILLYINRVFKKQGVRNDTKGE